MHTNTNYTPEYRDLYLILFFIFGYLSTLILFELVKRSCCDWKIESRSGLLLLLLLLAI